MGSYVICNHCGLVGHVKSQCPEIEHSNGGQRTLVLTLPEDRPRVTDRPRRCCGEPTIETVEGAVLDDTPARRGRPHICRERSAAA
jgi:hypothetical protein